MKKFLLITLAIILLLFAGLFIYYKKLTDEMIVNREQSTLREESVSVGKDPVGFLLLGVDGMDGGRAATENDVNNVRADSIIYGVVNTDTGQVSTVSIPRDTYVYIPCIDDYDKITNAYHYGLIEDPENPNAGIECTIAAVEGFTKMPVDYFAQVNFNGFMAVVDAIGGIDIVSNSTMSAQDENDVPDAYQFEEGVTYHMDGSMALAYCRSRHDDSDFMRGMRQQQVIQAIVSKILSDPLNYGPKALNAVRDYVVTNATAADAIQVLISIIGNGGLDYIKNLNIVTYRIYGVDAYDSGGSYVFVPYQESMDYVFDNLQQILLNEAPSEIQPMIFPEDDMEGVYYEGTPYIEVTT